MGDEPTEQHAATVLRLDDAADRAERPDHRVLAVEIKLGVAVAVATGSVAHRRPDGIAVVPLAFLEPDRPRDAQ